MQEKYIWSRLLAACTLLLAYPIKAQEVGEPVPGLRGGVWADRNNDNVVDGFVFNGIYYPRSALGGMNLTALRPDLGGVQAAQPTQEQLTVELEQALASAKKHVRHHK